MLDKAMILAAGFGTRLRPLTDSLPKALIRINGKPMLQLVIEKLIDWGIKDVVINTHHHAELIEKYVAGNKLGININLTYEKEILGTGGGIKNAEKYLADCDDFLVHNVDVISDLDFNKFYSTHKYNKSIATLALKKRETSRPLLFDESSALVGRNTPDGYITFKKPDGNITEISFCGIHIISSKIFSHFQEQGFFDIFTSYFRMIREGTIIKGYDIGNKSWTDLSRLAQLKI